MSSIHYKFRSLVSYKTLNFDQLQVGVEDLKQRIFDAEGLSPENFDLVVQNSHTKREYGPGDVIPRNSSLIIIRIPRQDGAKISKIQDTSTSGIVAKSAAAPSDLSFIQTEDYSKMSEEERIKHIKQQSFQRYDPSTYSRRPAKSALSDPPPPSYVCSRCGRGGHWVKTCPLVNVKRTTGIPMEELVETTADDPHAMLHPSGKFMVQRMHLNARLESKATAPMPFVRETPAASTKEEAAKSPAAASPSRPPPELTCPLCREMFRDAVLMSCCRSTFCFECVQRLILENPERECPGGGCTSRLSLDAAIPNNAVRSAVLGHKREAQSAAWPGLKVEPAVEQKPAVPAPRIRIDLTATGPPPVIAAPSALPAVRSPVEEFADAEDATTPPHVEDEATNSPKPVVELSRVPPLFPRMDVELPPGVQPPPPAAPSLLADFSRPPPSVEAAAAFSAFNPAGPTAPSGLLNLLPDFTGDVLPPGMEDASGLPALQPVGVLDPKSGRLLRPAAHSSRRDRRRDSASPDRSHRRRRSPSSPRRRREDGAHRRRFRSPRSPARVAKRDRRDSKDDRRHRGRKHSRSPSADRSKAKKRKTVEKEEPVVEAEEHEIDSIIKEAIETIDVTKTPADVREGVVSATLAGVLDEVAARTGGDAEHPADPPMDVAPAEPPADEKSAATTPGRSANDKSADTSDGRSDDEHSRKRKHKKHKKEKKHKKDSKHERSDRDSKKKKKSKKHERSHSPDDRERRSRERKSERKSHKSEVSAR